MTRARKAALQWFHDRGAIDMRVGHRDEPTATMVIFMVSDGHLAGQGGVYSLTDKGRRALHGDQSR